ncbi:hypothetical protein DOTSEDRAFT_74267 [Dothistroma septosporum NZE10]|uniref:Uncharacterized protein n=1 Tax=Dothistroma septosporum (strain NZE10 / CBS 128990) TaxID=675120 RepID=N1PE91_DOTSN|nr:hypothetical protein DOTSEDRAFT_74267 [Dothistroma septosporum NZE10]
MAGFAVTMRAAAFRAPAVYRAGAVRSFQSCRVLAAGKETKPGDEARKEEIEREKQQQLKEQKEGRNEWKDALASESESILKADRGEVKASKETISELQKESAKAVEREKKGQ